jgi:hypothetical protein
MKQSRTPRKHGPGKSSAQARKTLAAFQRYLDKWMNDGSSEQEESWKVLKKALEENRSGYRKLFRD